MLVPEGGGSMFALESGKGHIVSVSSWRLGRRHGTETLPCCLGACPQGDSDEPPAAALITCAADMVYQCEVYLFSLIREGADEGKRLDAIL